MTLVRLVKCNRADTSESLKSKGMSFFFFRETGCLLTDQNRFKCFLLSAKSRLCLGIVFAHTKVLNFLESHCSLCMPGDSCGDTLPAYLSGLADLLNSRTRACAHRFFWAHSLRITNNWYLPETLFLPSQRENCITVRHAVSRSSSVSICCCNRPKSSSYCSSKQVNWVLCVI